MPKTIEEMTTKLNFTSFNRHQFGRGWVAFDQSEAEKSRGRYDPHVMFVHEQSESYDEAVAAQVEQDCKDLSRLLGKFRIANEFITDKAKDCQVSG